MIHNPLQIVDTLYLIHCMASYSDRKDWRLFPKHNEGTECYGQYFVHSNTSQWLLTVLLKDHCLSRLGQPVAVVLVVLIANGSDHQMGVHVIYQHSFSIIFVKTLQIKCKSESSVFYLMCVCD